MPKLRPDAAKKKKKNSSQINCIHDYAHDYSHHFQISLSGGTDVSGMSSALQGHRPCPIDLGDSGPATRCCVNRQLWSRWTLAGSRPGSRERVRNHRDCPQAPGGHVFLWERRVQPLRGNCCFSLCSCPSNIRDFLKLLKWPCQLIYPADPRGPRRLKCFAWKRATSLPTV